MMIDARAAAFAARRRAALDGFVLGRLLLVAVALATAACEIGLATILVRGTVGPVPVLAAHVVLCLVLGGLAIRLAHRPGEAAPLVHLTLWTFVAGPFGSLLAIGLAALDQGLPRQATDQDFGSWMEREGALGRPAAYSRLCSDLRDGRLRVGDPGRFFASGVFASGTFARGVVANSVLALGDVMASGDKEAKFEALAIIGRRFDPSLTHVIRAAIRDDDPSVRVLASTVLAKLQTRFTRELIALQAAASQAPGDAAAWLALAAARRLYAESGLIEPSQAQTELIEARVAARNAVAAAPQSGEARARLAELGGAEHEAGATEAAP